MWNFHRSCFFALEFPRTPTKLCEIFKGEVLLSLKFPRVRWKMQRFERFFQNGMSWTPCIKSYFFSIAWFLIRLKSLTPPKLNFPTLHLSCSPYLFNSKCPTFTFIFPCLLPEPFKKRKERLYLTHCYLNHCSEWLYKFLVIVFC